MAVSSAGGSNFKGLRRYTSPEEQDAKLRDVAKKYENQFMREMVKAMRGSVQESGLIKVGMGEKIFREELDSEYVNNWSDRGGVGFAQVIYDQLIEKYGAQLGITRPGDKVRGPLPLNEKSNFQGMAKSFPNSKNVAVTFQRAKDSAAPNVDGTKDNDVKNLPEPVLNPWPGKYLGAQQINPDEYKVEIKHDNGLKSRMVFRGLVDSQLKVGGTLTGGETLGYLSPEAQQLHWNLDSE